MAFEPVNPRDITSTDISYVRVTVPVSMEFSDDKLVLTTDHGIITVPFSTVGKQDRIFVTTPTIGQRGDEPFEIPADDVYNKYVASEGQSRVDLTFAEDKHGTLVLSRASFGSERYGNVDVVGPMGMFTCEGFAIDGGIQFEAHSGQAMDIVKEGNSFAISGKIAEITEEFRQCGECLVIRLDNGRSIEVAKEQDSDAIGWKVGDTIKVSYKLHDNGTGNSDVWIPSHAEKAVQYAETQQVVTGTAVRGNFKFKESKPLGHTAG